MRTKNGGGELGSRTARGVSQLAFDAVGEMTKVVEAMHSNVSAAAAPIGQSTDGRTQGITGFVYGSIRMASQIIGSALDVALSQFSGRADGFLHPPRSETLISVVNGVLGDHLVSSENPLAIDMHLRRHGRPITLARDALAEALPEASEKILVAVHGSCMNDRDWRRNDHDHCEQLADELGYTNIYLRYNSGRHISENGRDFADLLEDLIDAWPVPVKELSLLAHSMGGLVTRSACHYGQESSHRWLAHLRHVAFLGTPHHGAPLARGGNLLQNVLGFSPYTVPIARITSIRSAGITDLCHGNLIDEDWLDEDRFAATDDARRPIPLPAGVACYAVASTLGRKRKAPRGRVLGDGLVPVAGALGQHPDAARALAIPKSHQSLHYESNHWDLLSDPEIYARLRDWMC
jgi:hypothetical protein